MIRVWQTTRPEYGALGLTWIIVRTLPVESLRRAQPNLEHISQGFRTVQATAVPEAFVEDHDSTRWADHLLLSDDVLIASDRRLADDTKLRARHETSATHFCGYLVWKIKKLNIKGCARIYGAVLVGGLRCLRTLSWVVVAGWEGNV